MTSRRLREWPRAVAAVSVAAVLLIVIGVLVASATSGGSSRHSSTVSTTTAAAITHTTTVNDDASTLATLRSRLGKQTAALAGVNAHVHNLLTTAQCWRRKARHPRRTRALHCPLPA